MAQAAQQHQEKGKVLQGKHSDTLATVKLVYNHAIDNIDVCFYL